jgi:sigma-B regulation protein RsbU (phosphoserine phosphatase)
MEFLFILDLGTGDRWGWKNQVLRPSGGRLAWMIFDPAPGGWHSFRVRRRRFLLRYKLLLVLTLIPVITLSAYLAMAIKIFKEDKIAYVFDSTNSFISSLSSQFRTQLQASLFDARPYIQEFLLNLQFSDTIKASFKEESSLQHILVYRIDGETNNFSLRSWMSKTPETLYNLQQEIESVLKSDQFRFLKKIVTDKRNLIRLKEGTFAFFEYFESQTENAKYLFIGLSKLSEIVEALEGSKSQRVFILRSNGEILLSSDAGSEKSISQILDFAALAEKMTAFPQGVEDTRSLSGEEILLSYAKTGYADIHLLGIVSKEAAFSAVRVLVQRSIVFFGLLICLTVIVSLLAAGKLTSALTDLLDATKKVSEGDFGVSVTTKSNDEVADLSLNFNLMAKEISKLMMETAQKARMESELQTAKTVQETLFPATEAKVGPLEVAGFYEPASECGGDWWHYCHVGNKIYLWIGDATGHGAPAALITSAAKSAATLIESLQVDPARAIELMNQSICDVSRGRIMMTFVLACIDPSSGEMVYVNASHEAPLLIRKKEEPIKKKDLELLNETNNPRLGQSRDSQYQASRVQLQPGDFVFFYTDGVADVQNSELKAWGEREFLKNFIASYNGAKVNQHDVSRSFRDQFAKVMQEYRQSTQLVDDVTFFAVRYQGENKGENTHV